MERITTQLVSKLSPKAMDMPRHAVCAEVTPEAYLCKEEIKKALMHPHKPTMLYVACRCIRASFLCLIPFLLAYKHLNACSSHLADNDMLGCFETDSTGVSY